MTKKHMREPKPKQQKKRETKKNRKAGGQPMGAHWDRNASEAYRLVKHVGGMTHIEIVQRIILHVKNSIV